MFIMFNQICINEEMLPKYTHIYIYICIYICVCVCVYIYIYTHIYIYIHTTGKYFLYFKVKDEILVTTMYLLLF